MTTAISTCENRPAMPCHRFFTGSRVIAPQHAKNAIRAGGTYQVIRAHAAPQWNGAGRIGRADARPKKISDFFSSGRLRSRLP
jgi:hypothetical protein